MSLVSSAEPRQYGSMDATDVPPSTLERPTCKLSTLERPTGSNVANQQYRKSSLQVAENIHQIQKQCLELLNLSKQLSSSLDLQSQNTDPDLASKLNACMSSVKFLVSDTTIDIHGLVKLMPSLSSTQKIQVKRLRSDFEAVVQSYGNLQKSIMSKTARPRRRNPFDEYEKSTSDRQLLLEEEEERKHKQAQVLRQTQADVEILVNRQEIIQDLERNVVDINDIMKQLANMVNEQSEAVNSIECNVESASTQVTVGAQELLKASSHQTTRRRCTLFLLILAFAALIVLAIVLYFEFK